MGDGAPLGCKALPFAFGSFALAIAFGPDGYCAPPVASKAFASDASGYSQSLTATPEPATEPFFSRPSKLAALRDIALRPVPVRNGQETDAIRSPACSGVRSLPSSSEPDYASRPDDTAASASQTESTCLIKLTRARALWAADQITIVDVRPSDDYAAYRISDSINLPGHAIKTKAFLKPRHIVLVDQGYSSRSLERICRELRGAGFQQVSVLVGGLHAWWEKGAPLLGSPMRQGELNRLSPREFIAARSESTWTIIDASTASGGVREWFSSERIVAYPTDGSSFSDLLAGQAKGVNPSRPFWLVVTDHGQDYAPIEERLRQNGIRGVFFLTGGLVGYRDYHLSQKALLARVQSGPARVGRCSGL